MVQSKSKPMTMETAEQLLKEEVIPNGLYKVWQLQANNITLIFELFHVKGGFQEENNWLYSLL